MQQKLANLMKSENLSPTNFAKLLGVQASGVSHILSGRNKPSFDMIQKILRRFPKVNPDWLLMDSDQMYRDDSQSSDFGASPSDSPLSIDAADLFASIPSKSQSSPFSGAPRGVQNEGAQAGDFSRSNMGAFSPSESTTQLPLTSPPVQGVHLDRIVLIYSDGTFQSYKAR